MTSIKNLVNQIELIDSQIDVFLGDKLTSKQEEEKWLCENSLYLFIERAWSIIEPGATFIPGWHAQAIAEHLEALYNLDINRLLINVPPRCGKSNICSVIFPAWVWTCDPSMSFLYSSYANSLSVRDSIKCKRLINSPWYKSLWGSSFRLMSDVNNKLKFDNNQGGYRIASAVKSSATGWGATFEVEDDPNNVKESESKTIRDSTNDWHDFVMSTRYQGTLKEFRRLVIQQRTHAQDVSGLILSKEDSDWVHLCLPMEYERNNKCITIPLRNTQGKPWKDPRSKDGELLWPGGINAKQLEKLKKHDFRGDSYRIAGQLQQRPSPAEGGIIKKEWFKKWTERELPKIEYVLQSWDTALVGNKTSANSTSCYSACSSWGIFTDGLGNKNIILLSLYKGKVEYPELRRMAMRLAKNYYDTDLENPMGGGIKCEVDLVLIEAKVSGYSLASDLMRTNIPIMKFNPGMYGDKIARARRITDLIENGLVWLPCNPPSFHLNSDAETLINDCVLFPNGESNDTIDSMSQAFIRLKQTGWILNPDDYKPPIEHNWDNWKK
jgi:phage terminase large subunit-like protein